jgi:hypothetical protein
MQNNLVALSLICCVSISCGEYFGHFFGRNACKQPGIGYNMVGLCRVAQGRHMGLPLPNIRHSLFTALSAAPLSLVDHPGTSPKNLRIWYLASLLAYFKLWGANSERIYHTL